MLPYVLFLPSWGAFPGRLTIGIIRNVTKCVWNYCDLPGIVAWASTKRISKEETSQPTKLNVMVFINLSFSLNSGFLLLSIRLNLGLDWYAH